MSSKPLFFSGFCFNNESSLFEMYLKKSDFCVAGFSYGAQQAFEYALSSQKRIDTLQLFSPAFFQNRSEKYKKFQLLGFKKDAQSYYTTFLNNVAQGSQKEIKLFFMQGSYEELEALLMYDWDEKKLQQLLEKNIKIEVFLGQLDKIIDAQAVYDFFKPYATVYFIKNSGHIL
jgi:pimeloyl-ACP methyl ester carboxylesterase